ncbi:MAG: hypothetical protein KAS72_12555 [Phycisphaerales bacterium]|nr:hypothetical protein [Phycisphaerales bacterium]
MLKTTLRTIVGLLAVVITVQTTQAGPRNVGDWLVLPQCEHRSTENGKPYDAKIYAGMNGDLVLYFIRHHDKNICIEATTGFIGYTPAREIVFKQKGMLVDPESVPPAAEDLTLDIKEKGKGYTLTITRGGDVWVCDVPKPSDPYQELLDMPRNTGKRGKLHRNVFDSFDEMWGAMEERADKEGGEDPPPDDNKGGSGGLPSELPSAVQQAQEHFRNTIREIVIGAFEDEKPTPRTEPQHIPGQHCWRPPYDGAGVDAEDHSTWLAAGIADPFSGEMIATCSGFGPTDSKTRAEMIVWVGWSWNATGTGELSIRATFMEVIACGVVYDPISQGTSGKYCVDTGYIWIGARNERTGEDIWHNKEIGRAPMSFIELRPLVNFTASGLDVQFGDEITILVGICNYSSGKYGGTSHGEIAARVHEVKAEID